MTCAVARESNGKSRDAADWGFADGECWSPPPPFPHRPLSSSLLSFTTFRIFNLLFSHGLVAPILQLTLSRRKLGLIGSHTLNPSLSLPVRALQLVICYRSPKDLWSLPPLRPPTLLSSRMRKVRRKHRASNLPPSTRRNTSPIHPVSLLLHHLSLKSPENPHLLRPPRYLLLISLFATHPPLAPQAPTYHHTPRLVNQQRHLPRALEKQLLMVLLPLAPYHLSRRLSLPP